MTETLDALLAELLESDTREPAAAGSYRERIGQAALEIFAERSYEGATTKSIAERAGVTERTLFKHFPSKEELFARTVFPALLQVITPITVQQVIDLLHMHEDNFETTLRALVADRMAFAVRHPRIITMAVREGLLRPAFRNAMTTAFDQHMRPLLEQFISQAQKSGEIRDLPTEVVLRAIIGQMSTYVVTRVLLSPDASWDDEVEVERIVALIMRGIGAVA